MKAGNFPCRGIDIFPKIGLYLIVFCASFCGHVSARSLGYSYLPHLENSGEILEQLEEMVQEHRQRNQHPGFQQPLSPDTWQSSALQEDEAWSQNSQLANLGQVSGIDVDKDNQVHIFHRGNVEWNGNSFIGNTYRFKNQGPIKVDTILVLNSTTGNVTKSWGKDRFYMPHSITVSGDDIWVTDVALHQVMKFSPGHTDPVWTFGKAFVPGSDDDHLCKPTDVAVASNKMFYVSDGYCNSRILMFSEKGKLINQFGTRSNLVIPHSLTLIEKEDLLCVANREMSEIICFLAGLVNGDQAGRVAFSIGGPSNAFMGHPYAIAHLGDLLFIVEGPEERQDGGRGLTVDIHAGKLLDVWRPKKGFSRAHDVAVAPDGSALFVAQIGAGNKVVKFTNMANKI